MATQQGPLFPSRDPIAEETKDAAGNPILLVTRVWSRWLLGLREAVDLTPISIPVAPVEGASDTVPTTAMDSGGLNAGLFSISWYMAVVVAAGVSSSAQVTIGWIDSGVSKSYTAAAMTGNTTTTVQVNEKLLIYADAGSPITYAIAYASNPANAMTFNFRPVLQSVATS